jgi:hypothetical protein
MLHASCQTAQPEYRISTQGFWAKLRLAFASSDGASAIIAENNLIRASSRHWLM